MTADHIDRAAEETCGHTVVDADGIEEPCGLPVALGGWRYYEGHEHEDMLRRVCADHEQWALSNGIRARDAEVAEQARAEALAGAVCVGDEDERRLRRFATYREQIRAEVLAGFTEERKDICGNCGRSPCYAKCRQRIPDPQRRLVGPWEPAT